MRRANEYHAVNPGVCAKRHRSNNQTVALVPRKNVLRGIAQIFFPHLASDRGYLHVRNNPSHAMPNQDIRTVIWVDLINLRELLTQSKCGISNRISGRIAEYPKLITFAYLGIGLQSVDCVDPCEW